MQVPKQPRAQSSNPADAIDVREIPQPTYETYTHHGGPRGGVRTFRERVFYQWNTLR